MGDHHLGIGNNRAGLVLYGSQDCSCVNPGPGLKRHEIQHGNPDEQWFPSLNEDTHLFHFSLWFSVLKTAPTLRVVKEDKPVAIFSCAIA